LIYYENGKKQKMHPRRVKFIEFVDYQGNFKRIVSPRFINDFLLEDQKINYQVNYLFVEMYVGKIRWYRRYMRDSYDHSEKRSDFYILDGKWYKRNQFISAEKFFKFLLNDYPQMITIIEEKKFSLSAKKYDAQVKELLIELDDIFKNEQDLNSIQNE
jgi:hypothetical protein